MQARRIVSGSVPPGHGWCCLSTCVTRCREVNHCSSAGSITVSTHRMLFSSERTRPGRKSGSRSGSPGTFPCQGPSEPDVPLSRHHGSSKPGGGSRIGCALGAVKVEELTRAGGAHCERVPGGRRAYAPVPLRPFLRGLGWHLGI